MIHAHVMYEKYPSPEALNKSLALGDAFAFSAILEASFSLASHAVGFVFSATSLVKTATDLIVDWQDPYFDYQIRNSSHHIVLGMNYQTGQMTNTSSVGIWSGRTDGVQIVLLSRRGGPYNITVKLDAPDDVDYIMTHHDSIEDKHSESTGSLSPGESISQIVDMVNPSWTVIPGDQTVELGDNLDYNLGAYDLSGISYWWINDTTTFNIDINGMISNIISFAVGDYGLEVRAYDPYDNYCSASFKVIVQDTTDPSWAVTPTDQILEYREALDYQLQASDLSGIARWTVTDTIHFAISGSGRLTNRTTLEPGVYSFTVSVYDAYDNYVSATITITVQQPSTPTEPTTPSQPQIPGFPLIAIVMGLVLSLLMVGVLRKKRNNMKSKKTGIRS
jgi:hypothetical protein